MADQFEWSCTLHCDAAKSEFKYLAFEGDLIFSQLASVRRGDPVLFDVSFARSEAGSSEMFITNELGEEADLRPTKSQMTHQICLLIFHFCQIMRNQLRCIA